MPTNELLALLDEYGIAYPPYATRDMLSDAAARAMSSSSSRRSSSSPGKGGNFVHFAYDEYESEYDDDHADGRGIDVVLFE